MANVATFSEDKKVKTSSIFIQDLTCIDHAVLTNDLIVGGSFMASFIITGPVEGPEQVVVDFSTLKRAIKHIIDDNSTGLDHKLWLFPNKEDITLRVDGSYTHLSTKHLKANLPSDCLAVIPQVSKGECYNTKYMKDVVRTHVKKGLNKLYPGVDLRVECLLSEEPSILDIPEYSCVTKMFRYFHGLKDSSSYGCQNPVHGHLSYVSFYYKKCRSVSEEYEIRLALEAFVNIIDKSVFIYDNNVDGLDPSNPSNWIELQYLTEDRGNFRVQLDEGYYNLKLLPEETTIENLTVNLIKTYCDLPFLMSSGLVKVAMSEGLQKGCIIDLEDLYEIPHE